MFSKNVSFAVQSGNKEKNRLSAFVLGMVVTSLFMSNPAFALNAGFGTATTLIDDVIGWAYALIGIAGGGFVLWKAVQAWSGKADWMEVGKSLGFVALAGGSLKLATWAFTSFQ